MKRKRFSVKQIVMAVKQHEMGVSATDIARKLGIAEQTFCRWNKQYGGLAAALCRPSGPNNGRAARGDQRPEREDGADRRVLEASERVFTPEGAVEGSGAFDARDRVGALV